MLWVRTVGELIELNGRDIDLARLLIAKYHSQGVPLGSGAARRSRWFGWLVDGYICAVAWLHDNTPFRYLAEKFKIGSENSYFIRRICKTCPGDHLVAFLQALADKLRAEGKECVWTLGLDDHSNALYKKSGFEVVGYTKNKQPVFVKRLQ